MIYIVKKFIRFLTFLTWEIIFAVSYFIPKNKNIWIFGALNGEKYVDNSKHLFEYVSKNHPEIRAIWTTKNRSALNFIRNQGFEAYGYFSIRAILLTMRAEYSIVSHQLMDIPAFAAARIKSVVLWHGTPLKKIGFDDKKTVSYQSLSRKISTKLFHFFRANYKESILFCTSDNLINLFSQSHQIPKERIFATGYPRNDVFFHPPKKGIPITRKLNSYKEEKYKIAVYMPTHRKFGQINICNFLKESISQINENLKKLNSILLVKLHFFHLKELKDQNQNYTNIIFITDEDINQDIYPILPQTDLLITDYSSIFFDYLLLNKPIIFAPFDKEDYLENDRDFYFDYDKITPGPKAMDWDEVLNQIRILTNNPDLYKIEREKIRNEFNKFTDGNSSKRIFERIIAQNPTP